MKKVPFYKSNFSVPDIPQKSLYSQRIHSFDVEKNRLSVFAAPAGFGKTTAVLLSLSNYRDNIRWYRMNREDSILQVWYSRLIKVLFSGDDTTSVSDTGSMGMLASIGDIEDNYPLLNAQIVQDVYAMCENSDEHIFLVFDDFHFAVDSEVIIDTIQYFVENFPQHISIVVTSRRDPKIISGRIALRSDVRKISAKDLLFTKSEAYSLIEDIYELNMSVRCIDAIYKRTEGWAAGIYLLCGNKKISDEDIEIIGTGKKGEEMFSLFLSKYLRDIDDQRKKILIKLSLLEDFSCEELSAILSVKDPKVFITWLQSGNFYIQKISTSPVRYRFHALFRDELNKLFDDSIHGEERCDFLKSVGEYYREKDPQLSIRFYLRGGFSKDAIFVAEKYGKDFFDAGTPEKMFLIISEFSDELINSNPYLLLYKGMFRMNSDREFALNTFMSVMDGFKRIKNFSFLMNTFGMLLVVAYQNNGFSFIKQAYKKLPVVSLFTAGSDARQKFIISVFIALTGQDCLRTARIMRRLLDRRSINNDMWDFSYTMIRGIYFYRCGNLNEAASVLERIIAHPVLHSNDQWKIIGLVSCCNIPFLCMDFDLMQYFINEFFLLGEKYDSPFASGYGHFMLAYLKYGKCDIVGAIKSIDNSVESFTEYGGDLLVKESKIIRALWDDVIPEEKTLHEIQAIYDALKFEKPGHGLKELAMVVLGVLYKRMGKFDSGYVMLTEALASVKRMGAKQSICGILLQLTDLLSRKGEENNAKNCAISFAELTEQGNYMYWREADISSIRSVYALLPEKVRKKSLFRIVSDMYGCGDSAENRKTIYQHIKISCRLLGNFSISCGEKCLIESDFKTRKVSGILKYLLTLDKGSVVPRERIAAVFWPDADNKSAFASLRVALYELRKTLAMTDMSFESENALLIEKKEGFTVNPNIMIEKDTDKLEKLYEEYRTSLKDANGEKKRKRVLEAICKIYDGEFLQGEFYDDWATVLREHYSSMYFEALYRFAQELIADDRFLCAEKQLMKGLKFEPLDEECCKLLVETYNKSGQKDRADHFLKKFSKHYMEEMGVELLLK